MGAFIQNTCIEHSPGVYIIFLSVILLFILLASFTKGNRISNKLNTTIQEQAL